MNEDLTECFKHVRDSLNSAMAHYQIWFTLRGEGKAIKNYLNDMSDYRYVDFFHAANSGNYKLMFIETACLFDSDDRTQSIRNLKSLMNKYGLSDIADKFENMLKPYAELVSNIKTIRSRVIAHKEADVDPSELYKKHGIKPDDIKDLLNLTADLLRELESKLTNNSSSHSVVTTDRWERATFNLLESLKTGRSS
jgi:AbiU2